MLILGAAGLGAYWVVKNTGPLAGLTDEQRENVARNEKLAAEKAKRVAPVNQAIAKSIGNADLTTPVGSFARLEQKSPNEIARIRVERKVQELALLIQKAFQERGKTLSIEEARAMVLLTPDYMNLRTSNAADEKLAAMLVEKATIKACVAGGGPPKLCGLLIRGLNTGVGWLEEKFGPSFAEFWAGPGRHGEGVFWTRYATPTSYEQLKTGLRLAKQTWPLATMWGAYKAGRNGDFRVFPYRAYIWSKDWSKLKQTIQLNLSTVGDLGTRKNITKQINAPAALHEIPYLDGYFCHLLTADNQYWATSRLRPAKLPALGHNRK